MKAHGHNLKQMGSNVACHIDDDFVGIIESMGGGCWKFVPVVGNVGSGICNDYIPGFMAYTTFEEAVGRFRRYTPYSNEGV